MRSALAMSLNVPAVKTLYLAGVDSTIELSKRLGIATLNRKNFYGLSLVLGGGEITLLDGTAAYGVFANDGVRAPVESILKVTDDHDQSIEYPFAIPHRALEAEVARAIEERSKPLCE